MLHIICASTYLLALLFLLVIQLRHHWLKRERRREFLKYNIDLSRTTRLDNTRRKLLTFVINLLDISEQYTIIPIVAFGAAIVASLHHYPIPGTIGLIWLTINGIFSRWKDSWED